MVEYDTYRRRFRTRKATIVPCRATKYLALCLCTLSSHARTRARAWVFATAGTVLCYRFSLSPFFVLCLPFLASSLFLFLSLLLLLLLGCGTDLTAPSSLASHSLGRWYKLTKFRTYRRRNALTHVRRRLYSAWTASNFCTHFYRTSVPQFAVPSVRSVPPRRNYHTPLRIICGGYLFLWHNPAARDGRVTEVSVLIPVDGRAA